MTEHRGIDIKWEWLSAPEVKAPELRATWTRLEIYAGTDCLTLVEDRESGSARRSIYCPLYPLAEWIAYNWWFLKAHSRPAAVLSRPRSSPGPASDVHLRRQRHSLRSAGDGFIWPNLMILPEGESTRLVWQADKGRAELRGIRFLSSGSVSIASTEVQQQLAGLVERVIDRLLEEGLSETALETEWKAIRNTDAEEAEFCLASARLGLDPYSEAEKYESDILRAATELDRDLFGDFMDVVQPERISAALQWVTEARAEIQGFTSQTADDIDALRIQLESEFVTPRMLPWEKGWAQARWVRELLGINPDTPLDPASFVHTSVRAGTPRGLQALGGETLGSQFVVVTGDHQPKTATRFTLARSMWNLLWRQRTPLFLVTSAYTDHKKIERAFAAELLAPAEGITERLSVDSISMGVEDRELEELAQHYRVSPTLIQHQLDNQVLR